MKKAARIFALAEMLVLPQLRSPATYAMVLAFPLLFLYMFWIFGGLRLAQHALFGNVVAIALNSGIISLPQVIANYKVRRLQDIYVASPVTAFDYIMGHGISRLLFALPGCGVMLAVLLLFHFMPLRALPATLLVLLITWATGCAIGFMIASYMDNPVSISAIANLVGLVMVLLPPVSYPMEMLQSRWKWLALAAPSTNAAQLVKVFSGVSQLGAPQQCLAYWAVLIFYCVLFFWIALHKSRWRES